MASIKNDLGQNEKNTEETLRIRNSKRMVIPNLLKSEVPIGKDETGNK